MATHLLALFQDGKGGKAKGISGIDPDRPPGNNIGLLIGSNASGFPLLGLMDEVRVVGRALPAEWIEIEHANQSSPATFCTVGELETR